TSIIGAGAMEKIFFGIAPVDAYSSALNCILYKYDYLFDKKADNKMNTLVCFPSRLTFLPY
ncbi:hypothetical protein K2P47_04085, partial [Patescibacteria group bacterium]|nr:hypothetical protein [Patescibacteria group bacterium]